MNGKHTVSIAPDNRRGVRPSPKGATMNESQAVGYIRCSTLEQADSGLGLDAQAERIRAYCAMRKLLLLRIVTDAGVSGGKPLANRPGGKALLEALRTRKANSVIMLKLDRGFRNAGDCLSTVDRWERSGVSLHVVDLGGNAIDTTSAAGRFMLVVLAGAAEMERNLTRERTRSALAVKKAAGQKLGGTVPYGYDLAPDGTTLIENLDEQAILAEIQVARAAGRSLRWIADDLNARGIPPKTGARWYFQVLARILKRPAA